MFLLASLSKVVPSLAAVDTFFYLQTIDKPHSHMERCYYNCVHSCLNNETHLGNIPKEQTTVYELGREII